VRVLLLEDDARVAQTVGDVLRKERHFVDHVSRLREARAALDDALYELAILDVGLPDGTGTELCRQARLAGHSLPILLLTARNEVQDRVEGLDAGADDFLGKPFAVEELLARVRALGRRGPQLNESVRIYGSLVIDRERRTCMRSQIAVALTPREFDLVTLLAWRDGRVVMRDDLLEAVWGENSERTARSLDVFVARIRRKLDTIDLPSCIRTERNLGYAWARDRSRHG
jgi:two-component system OmpR family response regulator